MAIVSDPSDMVRMLTLSVLLFCPFWLVVFYRLDMALPFSAISACAVLLLAALWLNARGRTRTSAHLLCCTILATICVNSARTGCAHSLILYYLACVPLIATVVGAPKRLYATLSAAAVFLIWALDAADASFCRRNVLAEYHDVLLPPLALALIVAITAVSAIFTTRVAQEIEARELYTMAISHDLRSPLHGLTATVDYMHERALQGQPMPRDELLEQLETAKRCGAIVNGVLRSVSESQWLSELETVDVREMTFEAVYDALRAVLWGAMSPDATAASFALHVTPERARDALLLRLDLALLCRVVGNLASNAVKYGGGGGLIDVRVRLDATAQTLRVDVVDRGAGIPAQSRQAIFEKFVRLSHGPVGVSRGVGLYLCRRIVQQLGGSIGVMDRDDGECGTQFSFTLPVPTTRCDEAAAAAAAARPTPPVSPLKALADLARGDAPDAFATHATAPTQLVLSPRARSPPFDAVIIDDAGLNCRLLEQFLRRSSLDVREIASFQRVDEAFEWFRVGSFNERPLVVLLDLQLGAEQPTGHEFIRTLRALEATQRHAPFIYIAVTASVTDKVREQCEADGFTCFLAKPCTKATVELAIESALSRAQQ